MRLQGKRDTTFLFIGRLIDGHSSWHRQLLGLPDRQYSLTRYASTSRLLLPVFRAISQLDDAAFRKVLLHSIGWSFGCFAALLGGMIWAVHRLLAMHGWVAWVSDIIGSAGALLLAFWLFLPVAAAIGTLYFDSIALAVERRFYPYLSPPKGAPIFDQVQDGAIVGLNVLTLNIVALGLALLLPGIGIFLGWMIAAYAIGRGLFVAAAMRRMPRRAAEAVYFANRPAVLLQGAILALAAYVPILNLFIPIIGTATMVHVLDMALTRIDIPSR